MQLILNNIFATIYLEDSNLLIFFSVLEKIVSLGLGYYVDTLLLVGLQL